MPEAIRQRHKGLGAARLTGRTRAERHCPATTHFRCRSIGLPDTEDGAPAITHRRGSDLYGFTQFATVIGGVQTTPPSVMVWLPPFSVASTSSS